MRNETHAARMDRLLRTLPPAVRGMGFGDPDDAESEYAHASDVVAWAINEIDRLRDERRWIPVEERLPEEGQEVLCACSIGNVYAQSVVVFYKDDLGVAVWEDDGGVMYRPTHWMPRLAPPKGREVE